MWAIVGKQDGLLWTWYPGPLTPRLTATLVDDIRKILAGEAVEDSVLAAINTLAVKLQLS